MSRVLFVAIALMMPLAHADFRGEVQVIVNPDAPRPEWRRVPLAGAYIAVQWTVVVPMPVHAIASCRYSELARTDERGQYTMDGPNPLTAALGDVSFVVYAPGLAQINSRTPDHHNPQKTSRWHERQSRQASVCPALPTTLSWNVRTGSSTIRAACAPRSTATSSTN